MELSSLKELGIAVVAVGMMGYICFKLIKEIAESRADYKSFVEENNHTTTELIREATATMVSINDTIKVHNSISDRLLTRLDK